MLLFILEGFFGLVSICGVISVSVCNENDCIVYVERWNCLLLILTELQTLQIRFVGVTDTNNQAFIGTIV